jgi:signal transduction histidine kinase
MRRFHDQPIRSKLMIAIVGTSGLAVFLASAAVMGYQWVNARNAMLRDLAASMQIIAANSTAALSFHDAAAAEQTLSALRAKPDIALACIYAQSADSQAGAFASYHKPGHAAPCPPRPPADYLSLTQSRLRRTLPITIGPEVIGKLYIERSLDDFLYSLARYLAVLLLALLGSIAMAFGMSTLLQRFIARPIMSLAYTASRVSESKDYSIRAPKSKDDEVGWLVDSFNDMLAQVDSRDRALEQARAELEARVDETARANSELQRTLERLRQTQEQLVQTEKMASLGGLVAGIAHEINTPIGIGVTAASTLRAKTDALNREYEANSLTHSGLKRYVDLANQSTDIILSNLNRASELIQSFKQVAVDQSSSERRRFAVKPYLSEILLSLRPKLKKTRLRVEVHCDDRLEINSYPGALAQILTNLVMNSVIHAYDPDQSGTLSISVEPLGDRIRLRYSDDGKGMPPEHVGRVFDPFFTTKRGAGGSGLGMHIVFNLVTQQLGGTVTLHSELGKGTTVEIVMPAGEENQHEQPRYATEGRR